MTYTKRKELENLSLLAFGSKYAYQKRMKKLSHYVPDKFGGASGKRAAGYANVEQIEEAMIRIIEERENEAINNATGIVEPDVDNGNGEPTAK